MKLSPITGMTSPLLGVAAVNSLLFGSFTVSKRLVSPYPTLSTPEIATAGAMAGAITAVLASPVEMFKILMQGQYGSPQDKKLRHVAADLWRAHGFKNGSKWALLRIFLIRHTWPV